MLAVCEGILPRCERVFCFYKNTKRTALHLCGVWNLEECLVSEGLLFALMWIASGLFWTSPVSGIPAIGRQRDASWSCLLSNSGAFSHRRGEIEGGVSYVSLQGMLGMKTARQRSPQHDAWVRHRGPVTLSRLSLFVPCCRAILAKNSSDRKSF